MAYATKFKGFKGGAGTVTQMKCTDLCLQYNQKQVVSNLSFGVEQGDFLCIVGENGSGKSTLLKGLLGLKKPDGGTIVFEEGFTRGDIGYLPQQESTLEDFPATVKEIVRSGLLKSNPFRLFYGKEQKQMAIACLKALEIEDLSTRSFRELSGGQKQRVLLARAFAATRKMLILDEPFNGLDRVVSAALYRAIAEKNQGEKITVIMVSHDVEKAMEVSNKILHLGNHDFFFGTPEEYRNSELGQAFLKGVSSCG